MCSALVLRKKLRAKWPLKSLPRDYMYLKSPRCAVLDARGPKTTSVSAGCAKCARNKYMYDF